MIPSPSLPWFELARFGRSRLTKVAIVAVLAVPLLYGAMYVWANVNPTGNLDHVKAAVVNTDKMVETTDADGKKQPVAVGRQLAGNLVSNDDKNNYDWVLTDAKDAQKGLADGEYKAVLTIPENLSSAATSTSGDPAEALQGNLDLQTNDAVNYINGTIAQTILGAAKSALNAQVTETYLDNVYLSFSDIKISLSDAADGAGKLADGADQLADGSGQLADGAQTLADGNRQLDSGAQRLSSGLTQLDDQTAPLAGQSQRLADGSRQVADGTAQLNDTVQPISRSIRDATEGADGRIDALAGDLDALADQCEANPPPGFDCGPLRDAADDSTGLKDFVSQVRDQAAELGTQTQRLADGAEQVADGNAQLAAGVPRLVAAISDAADGANQLAGATGQLADGADQLATKTDELSSGADDLSAGALKLENGLRDGAGQVPDYDESERDQLAKTAATPIEEAAERVNGVKNYGAALAPYFISLALWVGAMAIYLLLRPLSARAIASTAGSVRTALAGFIPGLAIAVGQVALLLVVLQGLLGIDPANQWLLIGMCLATAAVFVAINQMFIALFGGAGRFAALVFVSLQLTSAGGTYPIETAPPFFNVLHDLLPMTYAVHGIRAALAGGTEGVTADFVVLAGFLLLALAVTVFAARGKQTLTMTKLHPTLQV